ncbi:MAG: 1-acyl-sn-glycerol-3-phosphate acyltransferase [Deltaproteobacteria bacterium]|nr:1-acyl-sn-glycerol-3-phosphate acyltransferase [Deltaproteobacteria bacterium]
MQREGDTLPASKGFSALDYVWGVIATGMALLYTAILIWPAALASLFADGHLCSPIFKLWAWLIFRSFGLSVEVVGSENLDGIRSFVLVSNHQSLFDILAVLLLIPREMRFLAKREIKKVPVIGFTMERSENIVIDRASGGKTIRRALTVVEHGYSICVFAEGHRFNDNRVHEFNEGAAWLAAMTKLPCIPMAITGTAEVMPRGARLAMPRRRVRIVLRKPISTGGLKGFGRHQLTERLQAEVKAAFSSASVH